MISDWMQAGRRTAPRQELLSREMLPQDVLRQALLLQDISTTAGAASAGAAPMEAAPAASTETSPPLHAWTRPQRGVFMTHGKTPVTTCAEKPTTLVFVAVATTKDIDVLGSGKMRAPEVTMANGCLFTHTFFEWGTKIILCRPAVLNDPVIFIGLYLHINRVIIDQICTT